MPSSESRPAFSQPCDGQARTRTATACQDGWAALSGGLLSAHHAALLGVAPQTLAALTRLCLPLFFWPARRLQMPKGSDSTFAGKLQQQHAAHPRFGYSTKAPGDSFTVHHYAGAVTYSCAKFLDKNRDTLSKGEWVRAQACASSADGPEPAMPLDSWPAPQPSAACQQHPSAHTEGQRPSPAPPARAYASVLGCSVAAALQSAAPPCPALIRRHPTHRPRRPGGAAAGQRRVPGAGAGGRHAGGTGPQGQPDGGRALPRPAARPHAAPGRVSGPGRAGACTCLHAQALCTNLRRLPCQIDGCALACALLVACFVPACLPSVCLP